ncbi:sodium:solute symporter [Nocardiopsis sp. JB363]|uniref:sodium:solute symporter n=1 Tax=Nocardiopsis sp. JB363 TaxID=1434837 RepID=UPI00097BA287|nr:sodium:solute symporter [Nocardiopsis sp. JB363]SIO89107.1 sodium-solute symporter, putative [Nocardiopsis sp. JB363]
MLIDTAVIAAYLLGMVGLGWWGMRRAKSRSDYLVAGRRLGPLMYAGTMAAVVLGGASTVGGIGLGYTYGISGAWLVVAIGVGILALHLFFAKRISRLKVFTVSEMLDLRYGGDSRIVSALVMWGYTFVLTVPSTLAFSTIFSGLFELPRVAAIILGGSIVVLYSTMGGMWSVTMTDMAQFVIKTLGLLLVLTPVAVWSAGGFSGMRESLDPSYFDPTAIGGQTILTYFVIYSLGLLIGQDIWQRVFTGRDDRVVKAGGIGAGVYCLIYGVCGALIGTAAAVMFPNLANPDDSFTLMVEATLPVGVAGLVIAAALSAVMSTASGALIACSTVTSTDLWPRVRALFGSKKAAEGDQNGDEVTANRVFTLVLGVASICVALAVDNVVAALTLAYNILVGGLLVAILGGLVWRRGTRMGALTSMLAGSVAVIVTMAITGLLANEPIYVGLGTALVVYVAVSLLTPPTDPAVLELWQRRLRGQDTDTTETTTGIDEDATSVASTTPPRDR